MDPDRKESGGASEPLPCSTTGPRASGIHAFEIYFPNTYVDQRALGKRDRETERQRDRERELERERERELERELERERESWRERELRESWRERDNSEASSWRTCFCWERMNEGAMCLGVRSPV
jgi:hypothetical protein